MCICRKDITGGRSSKSKGFEARGGQEAKWGWDETGTEGRANGVGERIVDSGMEAEGRKGGGPYGPW